MKRKFFSWKHRWNIPVLMNLVIVLSLILVWQNITFYKMMRSAIEGQYKKDVREIIDTEVIKQLELQILILTADRDMYQKLWLYTANENQEIKLSIREKIAPLLEPYGCSLEWIAGEPLIKRTSFPEDAKMKIGEFK